MKLLLGVLSYRIRSCEDARGTPLCLTIASVFPRSKGSPDGTLLLISQVLDFYNERQSRRIHDLKVHTIINEHYPRCGSGRTDRAEYDGTQGQR